jgi:hypothetical protein
MALFVSRGANWTTLTCQTQPLRLPHDIVQRNMNVRCSSQANCSRQLVEAPGLLTCSAAAIPFPGTHPSVKESLLMKALLSVLWYHLACTHRSYSPGAASTHQRVSRAPLRCLCCHHGRGECFKQLKNGVLGRGLVARLRLRIQPLWTCFVLGLLHFRAQSRLGFCLTVTVAAASMLSASLKDWHHRWPLCLDKLNFSRLSLP